MMPDPSALPGYTALAEPDLVFHRGCRGKHPLSGLIEHGPYGQRFGAPSTLRLALLAPATDRAHSRFPGHALTPTGVMAIRCKQFHLPDL